VIFTACNLGVGVGCRVGKVWFDNCAYVFVLLLLLQIIDAINPKIIIDVSGLNFN
jgi:hypothetical protein